MEFSGELQYKKVDVFKNSNNDVGLLINLFVKLRNYVCFLLLILWGFGSLQKPFLPPPPIKIDSEMSVGLFELPSSSASNRWTGRRRRRRIHDSFKSQNDLPIYTA
jgi:hypothetical protein